MPAWGWPGWRWAACASSSLGVATGVCVLTNWLMAFLVTKEFSSLMEVLRPYGAFWLASAFCIFSVLFTLACVPETKGKTLEQITAHFEGR